MGYCLLIYVCIYLCVFGGFMKKRHLLSTAIAVTLALGTYQANAYDENFKGYEVHNITVKADAAKDEICGDYRS